MNTEITDIISRRRPGWVDLLIALMPPAAVLLLANDLPRWAFMWTLAIAVWMAFKWIMWQDAGGAADGRRSRRAGFFLGWAGTDAVPFLKNLPVTTPVRADWIRSLFWIALGAAMIWFGVRLAMPHSVLLAGWIGMIGTVLLLHFGLFDLLALAWRRGGIAVEPVMLRPASARSVADFWNRWNRGFRDLAYRKIFRPLHRRIGLMAATFGTFLFSGIIHDLMISLPARAGFGLPMLYFLIQFLAVMIERAPAIRSLRPWAHWLLTRIVVLGPLGLLFHRPFVETVFVPFLSAIGAT